MIWNIIAASLIIVAGIFGLVYWPIHANEIINTKFNITYGTESKVHCNFLEKNEMQEDGSINNCTFGQTVIYVFSPLFCIGLIAIGVAILYNSCRSVIM